LVNHFSASLRERTVSHLNRNRTLSGTGCRMVRGRHQGPEKPDGQGGWGTTIPDPSGIVGDKGTSLTNDLHCSRRSGAEVHSKVH
jgi:hypothetical protein